MPFLFGFEYIWADPIIFFINFWNIYKICWPHKKIQFILKYEKKHLTNESNKEGWACHYFAN